MAIDYSIVSALMPECILVLAAVFIFLGGAWFPGRMAWTLVALTACAMGGLMLSRAPESTMAGVDFASQQVANATAADVTNEMNLAGQLASASRIANDSAWVSDRLGQGLRGCALLFGVLFVIFATQSRQYHLYSEIVGCILLITAGLMLVSGAADLVLMFVGLELISIPTYVLLFVGRSGRASDEATAKYFYLSLLASAILLYGFATLYGLAGDTRFAAIQASLNESVSGPFKTLFPVAFLMILCGFSFKLASVPFHFYAPDVYQATTSFNAALLAVVPKIAGVIGVVRILVIGIPHESTAIWQIVVILAIVTMTLANAAALWQTDMRRLMAYSSIAHAGYLLIGLAAALAAKDSLGWGPSAVSAMVFYVMAYAAATIGTFAALAYLSDDDERFSTLTQLKGIGRAHPLIGGFIAICMFSLAGIPPLAGFLGKFALFRSALDAALPASGGTNGWFLTLCILGVLNAAVAAAYYLRVVAVLYFDSSGEPREELEVFGNHGAGLASMLSVLIVLAVGLFAGRAMTGAQAAAAAAWPHRTPELRGPRLGALIGEESAIRETSTLRNAVSGDRTSSHSVSSRMANP